MLGVEEALAIVLETAPVMPAETVPYLEAAGRVLQEEIRADRDSPPFDKAMMDGYAVIASDLARVPRDLTVTGEIPAGADPRRLGRVEPGAAARIMTGAPVPPGADAVLVVEETETLPGGPDRVRAKVSVRAGENLARRGEDLRKGDLLLAPGEYVGPGEIGVLASCGATRVRVGGRPRAAILATGDELVPPEETPDGGRIRNSNGPLLLALLRRAGIEGRDLGIAPDEPAGLRALLERGLETDVLLLSGGVSMGVYDLVEQGLRNLGVEILFERVAIKPGRPFTFGRRGGCLVFGCPGNPVSTYVIFQVFARAALRKMAGFRAPAAAPLRGILESPVKQRPGRAGYAQARAVWRGDHYEVSVLRTSGSADFVTCARGNALAILPPDAPELPAGAAVDLVLLDDDRDR
jgi:molybdopterin molybdotransferase